MVEMSVHSFHFYFLAAVLQGFVLSLIIIFKRPVKKPNVFIGSLLFLFSLSLLHGVLEESIHAFNSKFPFPMNYGFAFGPLIYFHFKGIVYPKARFGLGQIVHFLPSILIDFLFFIIFFMYVGNHTEWAYANVGSIQLFALLIGTASILQIMIYTYLIIRMMKQADIRPREFQIEIKGWFKVFFISQGVGLAFILIAIPIAIFNIKIFDDHSYLMYKPLGIITGACIYWLGYLYLLKKMDVVNRYLDRVENIKHSSDSRLLMKQQLRDALEIDTIYKDEGLTVGRLALHLGWSERDVSWIIGESFNTNFSDLINSYRIKAFKSLVTQAESKKYSIMGVAQEVGFNSKASFYRAFKKECGQTPSEFLSSENSKEFQILI